MRYAIVKMGRAVSLDGKLVGEYAQYGELRECIFTIGVRSRFGHWPTPEEVSDEEALEFADKYNMLFFHLSLHEKYETGIKELFETVLNEYIIKKKIRCI